MARPGAVMKSTRADEVSIQALCPAVAASVAAVSTFAIRSSSVGGALAGSCATIRAVIEANNASAQIARPATIKSLHISLYLCDRRSPQDAARLLGRLDRPRRLIFRLRPTGAGWSTRLTSRWHFRKESLSEFCCKIDAWDGLCE